MKPNLLLHLSRALLLSLLCVTLTALLLASCAYHLTTTPCRDTTRSWSHGAGACSHHGGVER